MNRTEFERGAVNELVVADTHDLSGPHSFYIGEASSPDVIGVINPIDFKANSEQTSKGAEVVLAAIQAETDNFDPSDPRASMGKMSSELRHAVQARADAGELAPDTAVRVMLTRYFKDDAGQLNLAWMSADIDGRPVTDDENKNATLKIGVIALPENKRLPVQPDALPVATLLHAQTHEARDPEHSAAGVGVDTQSEQRLATTEPLSATAFAPGVITLKGWQEPSRLQRAADFLNPMSGLEAKKALRGRMGALKRLGSAALQKTTQLPQKARNSLERSTLISRLREESGDMHPKTLLALGAIIVAGAATWAVATGKYDPLNTNGGPKLDSNGHAIEATPTPTPKPKSKPAPKPKPANTTPPPTNTSFDYKRFSVHSGDGEEHVLHRLGHEVAGYDNFTGADAHRIDMELHRIFPGEELIALPGHKGEQDAYRFGKEYRLAAPDPHARFARPAIQNVAMALIGDAAARR